VENLLKNAGSVEGKAGELLKTSGQDAVKSKDLIRLDEKVPLECDWQSTKVRPPELINRPRSSGAWSFHSLLKEMLRKHKPGRLKCLS